MKRLFNLLRGKSKASNPSVPKESKPFVLGLQNDVKGHFVTYQNADGSEDQDWIPFDDLSDAIMRTTHKTMDHPDNPPWPGEDGDVMTWIESFQKIRVTIRTLYVFSHKNDKRVIYKEASSFGLKGNKIKVFHWGGWLGWKHCSIWKSNRRVFGW